MHLHIQYIQDLKNWLKEEETKRNKFIILTLTDSFLLQFIIFFFKSSIHLNIHSYFEPKVKSKKDSGRKRRKRVNYCLNVSFLCQFNSWLILSLIRSTSNSSQLKSSFNAFLFLAIIFPLFSSFFVKYFVSFSSVFMIIIIDLRFHFILPSFLFHFMFSPFLLFFSLFGLVYFPINHNFCCSFYRFSPFMSLLYYYA